MVRISWVYSLRKEDLISYLEEFGRDASGTVEDLRKRLATFLTEAENEHKGRFAELEAKHAKGTSPLPWLQQTAAVNEPPPTLFLPPESDANAHNNIFPTLQQPRPNVSYASVMDKIRKWPIKYDGNKGPLMFIERIEELADVYEVDTNLLPRTMPELLKDKALMWYRSNNRRWPTWEAFKNDFLHFFLPHRYWEQLDDTIRQRLQQPRETFKDYALALQDMMRPTNYKDAQTLERIIRNSRQEFQLHIKRREFSTLDELLELAGDYEAIRRQGGHHEPTRNIRPALEHVRQLTTEEVDHVTHNKAASNTAYHDTRPRHPNPFSAPTSRVHTNKNVCRRCGQEGHFQNGSPSILLGVSQAKRAHHRMLFSFGKRNGGPSKRGRRGPKPTAAPLTTTNATSTNSTVPAQIGTMSCNAHCLNVLLHIGGVHIQATIDTGATASFMSEQQYERIRHNVRTKPHRTTVRFADGSTQDTTQVAILCFVLEGKTHEIKALILPNATDDLVLGLDYLRKAGASIRIGNQSFTFKNTPGLPCAQPHCAVVRPVTELQVIEEYLATELPRFETLKGTTPLAAHRIIMKDDQPVKQRYLPRNPAMLSIINQEIDELLHQGCIEPSNSPHSSPIVLVKKKTGKWRLCIDFRQINAKSIQDAYPLPRIQSILDRLRGAKYISTLDLKNGYWQVAMEPDSKAYTAFTVPGRGLFQWKVMPFGLHSAPATFQRLLDRVIGPDLEPFAFAYLDDIIVIGRSLDEHKQNLSRVLQRLYDAKLRINVDKCEFFKSKLKYLGHMVSEAGVHTDPDKVSAILELKPPTNIKEVRGFLGIASWYRKFVPEFAKIAQPLTSLLKKGKHWRWEAEQQEAFEKLKKLLTEAPVLACPDFAEPFVLQTDASNYGLGVVLTQNLEGVERVIAYASRLLNKAEMNYSPTEKECLAIVWGVRKMRPYLEGYHFTVITDHLSLKWLNTIESPTGRVARWALELQQYSFDIEYRRGKLNVVADALSRQPLEKAQRLTVAGSVEDECKWLKRKMDEVLQQPGSNPEYSIVAGQLYRCIPTAAPDDENPQLKLCVPKSVRPTVLQENHATPCAGHLGMRKTALRVMNKYYWPGMLRDIRRFVKSCDLCQRYKPSQQLPAGEMLTRVAEAPWETICADFVGPLPRSKRGHTILLVFVDKFSKWVELVPLRRATSESLQKAFREVILARFGTPKVLISDNGTQFTCHKLRKFLEEIGIHHQFTAPYTPQEN